MTKTKSETTSWHKASKLIRCLAVSLIATFALALFPSAAWADTIPWTRLWGDTRYDTMNAISGAGWSSSAMAVVASGTNFPDALAASSLAGAKDCPILLTDPSALSAQTRSELQRLGAGTVYIVGGTAAVSANTENQIRALGCNVVRLAGSARQETATKVAQELGGARSDTCIIATGKSFADALSISPYSYAKRAPIYLTENNGTLSAATLSAIQAQGYSRAIIVGGTGVVSSYAESQLAQIGLGSQTRLGGSHRYETSSLIASWAQNQGMSVTNVGVAYGEKFPDALAGGALCGKNNSVLLLANASNTSNAASVVSANKANITKGYVFGGKAVVSDNTANTVFFASNNSSTGSDLDMDHCTITLSSDYVYWTGSAVKPEVTVKRNNETHETLKEGTDYTLSWANNTNVGKATVTITGKGRYTGSQSRDFYISDKKGYSYEMYVLGSADVPTYNGTTTIIYFKTEYTGDNLSVGTSAELMNLLNRHDYADLKLSSRTQTNGGLYKVDGGFIYLCEFKNAGTYTVSLREWDSAARTHHTLKSFDINVEDYEAAENAFIDEVIAKCTNSSMDSFEKMKAVSNYLYNNFKYVDTNGRYLVYLAKRSAPYFVKLQWDSYVSPAKLCKFAERIGGFDDIHNCYGDYSRSDPEWSYRHYQCRVTKGNRTEYYEACPYAGTSEISSYEMINLSDTALLVHLDPTCVRRKVK